MGAVWRGAKMRGQGAYRRRSPGPMLRGINFYLKPAADRHPLFE
jgi:hypothetical protein